MSDVDGDASLSRFRAALSRSALLVRLSALPLLVGPQNGSERSAVSNLPNLAAEPIDLPSIGPAERDDRREHAEPSNGAVSADDETLSRAKRVPLLTAPCNVARRSPLRCPHRLRSRAAARRSEHGPLSRSDGSRGSPRKDCRGKHSPRF